MLRFPVEVDIFPQRILGEPRAHDHARGAEDADDDGSDAANRRLVDSLVAHGMRAEIKSGNLLTGQKYVALDMYSGLASEHVNWNEQPAGVPDDLRCCWMRSRTPSAASPRNSTRYRSIRFRRA